MTTTTTTTTTRDEELGAACAVLGEPLPANAPEVARNA